MTEGGITQILLAIATLITAAGGVIIGWRNSREIRQVKVTGEKTHDLTNSKISLLIDEVRAGATNKAILDERAKVKAEKPV